MKTLQQIKKEYKSQAMDGRDLQRLAQFIPADMLADYGLAINDEYKGLHKHKEFTKDNILKQLKADVAFGFEKALGKRGISSSFMVDVVTMWNWILEEGLEDFGDDEDNYPQYGLPIFKATALKYGFDNPIGNDRGNEYKYSAEYDGE